MKKNSYFKVAKLSFLIILLLNVVSQAVGAPLPLPDPQNINVEPKGLSPNVQWTYDPNFVSPAAGQEFEVSYTENGGSPVVAGTVTMYNGQKDYQLAVSGLTEGKTYVFYVRTYIAGTHASNTVASGSYVPVLFTGNIGISTVQVFPNYVKVQIGDNTSGATSYTLYYQVKGSGNPTSVDWSGIIQPGKVQNYDVNNLNPNTNYEIWIVASNGSDSKTSNVLPVKTKRLAPATPVTSYFNALNVCPAKAVLSWAFVDHTQVDTYVIYDEFTNQIVGSGFAAAGQMTQEVALIPGRTYQFVIHAKNETGTGYSPKVNVAAPQYEAPYGPTNISEGMNITDKSFSLSWVNQNEDQFCNNRIRDQYEFVLDIVYRDGTTAQLRRYAFKDDNFKTFTEGDGLKPGAKVTVTMAAVNTFFNFRGYADSPVTVYLLGPPYDPSDLKVGVSQNALNQLQADVSWTSEPANIHIGGVTGSIIRILNPDGSVKETVKTNFPSAAFTIKPVEEGETITVEIAEYNQYGVSNFTAPTSYMVDYTKEPAAPAGLAAKAMESAVSLAWRDGSNREAETIVERTSDEGTTWAEIARVGRNVTTYMDADVTSGQDLGYRVKATNPMGDSPASNEVWVTVGTSIQGLINVFPNPTPDVLNLRVAKTSGETKVSVIDQNNRTVLKRGVMLKDGEGKLDISNLEPGAYQVIIETDGVQTSRKVFKY